MNDITIKTIIEKKQLPFSELTGTILGCCFDVMKELGPGFSEKIYQSALRIALTQKGLSVETERSYQVVFRGVMIGQYRADLIVNQTVIIELKCCDALIREHQAQLFNYLAVTRLPIGLLVNFKRKKLEWKRLQSNEENLDWVVEEDGL